MAWNIAPGNDDRTNESIAENVSLDNHHSENIGNGIPPAQNPIASQKHNKAKKKYNKK